MQEEKKREAISFQIILNVLDKLEYGATAPAGGSSEEPQRATPLGAVAPATRRLCGHTPDGTTVRSHQHHRKRLQSVAAVRGAPTSSGTAG